NRTELTRHAIAEGLQVSTMAFYEGRERCAELRFDELRSSLSFLLVVPQDRLEALLEKELGARGVRVCWGHRLDCLEQDENGVDAAVEKLCITSIGYPFGRSDEMVKRELRTHARFVVGADGSASHVREILGITTEAFTQPVTFEIFEFAPARDAGREVRVAFQPESVAVLWPQPGGRCRWGFEVE